MSKFEIETPGLDERMWRVWEARDRLRDRMRARKIWLVSGIVIGLLAASAVGYRLLSGS